ncbi:MAG: cupin domain-containing protein [Thermomicrobiales bacterium]
MSAALHLLDFPELAAAAIAPGVAWGYQGDDLNANLVVFHGTDGVATHTNHEVDVLVVGIAGTGVVEVDGERATLDAGQALIIPKGAARSLAAAGDSFAYLTCHRRRAGLMPQRRTG